MFTRGAGGGRVFTRSEQMVLNLTIRDIVRKEFGDNGVVFSVNGPPGTGKTTMQKEIVADYMVEHASVMVDMTLITAGQKKVSSQLYQDLLEAGCSVYTVGDNSDQSSFLLSTRSAMELAYNL